MGCVRRAIWLGLVKMVLASESVEGAVEPALGVRLAAAEGGGVAAVGGALFAGSHVGCSS